MWLWKLLLLSIIPFSFHNARLFVNNTHFRLTKILWTYPKLYAISLWRCSGNWASFITATKYIGKLISLYFWLGYDKRDRLRFCETRWVLDVSWERCCVMSDNKLINEIAERLVTLVTVVFSSLALNESVCLCECSFE